EILETFGLNRNGKSFRRLTAGFKRVFGSTIYFGIGDESNGREVFDCARFCFFDRMRRTSRDESIEPASANSTNRVELSEKFWAEIQAHPIPGELHAVRGFAKSPGCLEFYRWLTWPLPWPTTGGTHRLVRAYWASGATGIRGVHASSGLPTHGRTLAFRSGSVLARLPRFAYS
ncbi:MAG: hypothetical protein JO022_10670, partial [Acidobacteriaceae bacterium]|nr:hypothetical protein [Acidobacteriaceae bacterium]